MRGALVHGILLAIMLVYGYRTWTRDKTVKPDLGSVVLWDKSESQLESIELKSHDKIVKLEKKTQGSDTYWWGSETLITWKPKAEPPKPAAGSGSAGSGSAATPPKPEEEEAGRKTNEFPIAEGAKDTATTIIQGFEKARAMRDLGVPTPDQKKDYKLDDSKTTLTVTFKDGARTFLVGGALYAGTDKYVLDQTSGHAYIFSHEMLSGLEIGESSLHLTDVHGFESDRIDRVTIESQGREKVASRLDTTNAEGKEIKTWAEPGNAKGNTVLANFVDGLARLLPENYDATLKPEQMTLVFKITYADSRNSKLGTLALYKFEKAGELPPGQELDPANPPKGELDYYIVTEKTRVPAMVRRDLGQRAETDLETVFSNKPDEEGSGSGSGSGAKGPPPPPPPGLFNNMPQHPGATPPGSPAPASPAPASPAPATPAPAQPKAVTPAPAKAATPAPAKAAAPTPAPAKAATPAPAPPASPKAAAPAAPGAAGGH